MYRRFESGARVCVFGHYELAGPRAGKPGIKRTVVAGGPLTPSKAAGQEWILKGSLHTMSRVFVVLGLIFLLVGLVGCSTALTDRDASRRSIETLTAENTTLKSRIPTLAYHPYLSDERGVAFSYPVTWVRRDTEELVPLFVSPEGAANVGVTREVLPQAMTTNAYFDALNQRLQAHGYTLGGLRQMEVGSDSGLQAVYLSEGFVQVFVVVVKNQTAWSLIQTAKAQEFIDWAHTFGEIAHSFKVQ